ncbi:hypothetical protein [Rhodothalassium salexigens]|uniref:hypothetical protein n=1 Tax=Rhodothalassium salexigens TaxID=1086 RepID=UPI0019144AD1|nr:hypothetical protein [Rhodothalassium salexigens]
MPLSTLSVSIRRLVAVLLAWLVLATPALCDCGPAHDHEDLWPAHDRASEAGAPMALSAGPCGTGRACPPVGAGVPGAHGDHPMADGLAACDDDGCGLCAADMPQWSGAAERSGDPFWWGAGAMAVRVRAAAPPRAVACLGGVSLPAGPPPRVPDTLVALSVLLLA